MSKELQFPDRGPDREVADALHMLLLPPVNSAAYWDGLHRRIMSSVGKAAAESSWWAVSPTMARAGLLAAGLALLALGALALQTREMESRMAYQAVTETELEVARYIRGIDEPYDAAPRVPAQQR